MPAAMSASKVERFIRSMEDQGVGVTRTKKGLLLRLPDGNSTSLHFTNSDVRAEANLIARLRRAGVRHPDDPKGVEKLPSNITEGEPIARRTRMLVLGYMEKMGYPEYVHVLDIREATGLAHITATKALYQMEFIPRKGKRGTRDWETPPQILALKATAPEPEAPEEPDPASLTVEEAVADEVEVQPSVEQQPMLAEVDQQQVEPETPVVHQEGDREFLDSHDSWTVDIQKVSSYLLGEFAALMGAAGLEMEVRVWRR